MLIKNSFILENKYLKTKIFFFENKISKLKGPPLLQKKKKSLAYFLKFLYLFEITILAVNN